jgi:hypothetical protein
MKLVFGRQRERGRGGHRHDEAHDQGDQGAQRQPGHPPDQPGADPGERAELGADRHRAHDQDGVVEDHAAGRDHGREDHEGAVGEGEGGLLVGGLGQLLPQDGVGALARGLLLGLLRAGGQRQVDVLDGDRAVPVDAEPAQPVQQLVPGLAGDIAEDQVPGGLAGRAGEYDQVGGAHRALDQLDHGVRPVRRSDHP